MDASTFLLIRNLLNRPIAYQPIFADLLGGATQGIFLSQLYYWSDKGYDKDGWIYKTAEEWRKETRLTRREIEVARKSLKKLGLMEEKQVGQVKTLWYKLDIHALFEKLIEVSNVLPDNPDVTSDNADATSNISDVTSSISTIYTKSSHRPHTNIRACAEELNIQEKTPISSPQVDIPSVATTTPLEDKPTPQQYIPSSKKPKTPLKENPVDLVIPEVQPRQQWQSSARKCEDAFGGIPPWKTGTGRNAWNAEVVDFLIKSFLPKKPYYAERGEVTRGDAVGWLAKRSYQDQGIAEIEAMMLDFNDHIAKLSPLANAKTDVSSKLPSWVRLGKEWAFTQYREYLDTGFNAYKFGHPQSEIDIWEEYLSATYPGEIVERCAEKKRLAWSQIKQTA